MRSAIGSLLVLLGLATVVVLVLLLFSNLGTRSELEATRAELEALRAEVEAMEPGVTDEDLVRRLDELESGIRDWLIATGADRFDASPGAEDATDDPAGDAVGAALVERLDDIIERIDALDARVDEICGNVPVC